MFVLVEYFFEGPLSPLRNLGLVVTKKIEFFLPKTSPQTFLTLRINPFCARKGIQ